MGKPIDLKETALYLYSMRSILKEEYFEEMLRVTQYIYKISKEDLIKAIDTAWF